MKTLELIVERMRVRCTRDLIEEVRDHLAKDNELMEKLDLKSDMKEELNIVRAKEVAMKVAADMLITTCPDRVACELAEIAGILHEKSPKEYNNFLVLIGAKNPDSKKDSDKKEEDKGIDKSERFYQEARSIELRKEKLDSLEDVPGEISCCIASKDNKALINLLKATAAIPMGYIITEQFYSQESLAVYMADLYRRKNADYGNSFDKSLDEDGLIVAKIRIGDKINRILSLLTKKAHVVDESLTDTLIDLANYCVMTILWIQDKEE